MKEASDQVEREFKFEVPADDECVLSQLRPLLKRSWTLVKWSSRMILDIYLDAEGLPMLRDGATLRLRKRRLNPGWTATFKLEQRTTCKFLERREVRTSVTATEALRYQTTGLPGLAGQMASEWLAKHARFSAIDSSGGGPLIAPVVHLVSSRRAYMVRPGSSEHYSTNMLDLFFDDVTAFDMRGIDVGPLLRAGFFDYSKAVPSTAFSVGEIEVAGRALGRERESLELMTTLSDRLMAKGIAPVRESKYEQAMAGLHGRTNAALLARA